jgi:hypothetical protein
MKEGDGGLDVTQYNSLVFILSESHVTNIRTMATCNYDGMPVSLEDAMSLLNGATMHNITNLRDGGMVTFVALPSCHLCRLGYGPNSEFPADGKRCGGCRAVYYCNKVGVVVDLCVLGAFQPTYTNGTEHTYVT